MSTIRNVEGVGVQLEQVRASSRSILRFVHEVAEAKGPIVTTDIKRKYVVQSRPGIEGEGTKLARQLMHLEEGARSILKKSQEIIEAKRHTNGAAYSEDTAVKHMIADLNTELKILLHDARALARETGVSTNTLDNKKVP